MPISALPGDLGIGTLGESAYAFVDFLAQAKQRYWQILPLCPTGYGDSPYQSVSTFAGNPYFIDLKRLETEGYLTAQDYTSLCWSSDNNRVNYARLYTQRQTVFQAAFARFLQQEPADFSAFCREQADWLEDYALFMAIKSAHRGAPFTVWESDIRRHHPRAVLHWRCKCADSIRYWKMLQYFFYKQWQDLKKYANEKGIFIIGDIPIYVAADSADVWSNQTLFRLNDKGLPREVAGCPPDAFSKEGQLWGNPVYDWNHMKKDGYSWWVRRLQMSLHLYDVLRIDHFRGFDSYFCIPGTAVTAKTGIWRKGPGMALFQTVKKQLGELPILAEDLGFLTDSVKKLLEDSGFPGMKVLQFAFDSREDNDYLPENYPENCVVYTGTHDNDTILGWAQNAPPMDVRCARKYLGAKNNRELVWCMMDAALQSRANTCILTMQDLLELGADARMNTPSTVGGNWQWRMQQKDLNKELAKKLAQHTQDAGRC